jgi:hypothetical protein
MICGGCVPRGRIVRMVSETALICAMAPPKSASGWKYTLRIPSPAIDSDSMCSMSFTVVE